MTENAMPVKWVMVGRLEKSYEGLANMMVRAMESRGIKAKKSLSKSGWWVVFREAK